MASAVRPPYAFASPPALAGVGENLRRMFDSVVSDPLPDHILCLVDQLEAQNAADAEIEVPEPEARLIPA